MATHSSILAWRIPWIGEPGRLQSTGSQRVGHDLATTHILQLKKENAGKNSNVHTMEYHSATERNVTGYNMLFLFSCQVASDSAILWTPAHHASLFPTIFWSLPKFMSIESVMTPNHLIPCHPLLLLFSIFPSIRVFSNESALCIRWPKYLLAVHGTLKSLLQHHSSKASILQHSAFFYGPDLTSIHGSWEDHSLDYMDLCRQK